MVRFELEEGEELSLFNAFKIFHTHWDRAKKFDIVKLNKRDIVALEDKWSVFTYKQVTKPS
jgi:hypothetical protein